MGDRGFEYGERGAAEPAQLDTGEAGNLSRGEGWAWSWEVWKNGKVGPRAAVPGLQRRGRGAAGGSGERPWIWVGGT